jgi:hypothetical protein
MDGASVASIPMEMVELKLVSMVEAPSTGGAASALVFAQGGPSRTARRGLPASWTPIPPIPLVRTPIACDLRVSQTGGVRMGGEGGLTRTGGGRGTHQASGPVVPGPVRPPPGRCVGVSPACPGAQLHPGEPIQATQGRLTDPGAVVMSPTSSCGVELMDPGRLGPGLTRPHDATPLRKRFLHLGLGRGHQGGVPEALRAPRSLTRLVFPHPILPDGATEQVPARLIAFQGGAQRRVVDGQGQSAPREPCRQEWLTMIESGAIRGEHQAVIGVRDNTSCRRERGDGLVPPMPRHQR